MICADIIRGAGTVHVKVQAAFLFFIITLYLFLIRVISNLNWFLMTKSVISQFDLQG